MLLTQCKESGNNYLPNANDAEWTHKSMKQLTDVIVHDIFSPPQASRIYAYASLAGYEAFQPFDTSLVSLSGQLNELDLKLQLPKQAVEPVLASNLAMCYVGKNLIFSEDKMQTHIDSMIGHYAALGMSEAMKQNTINYAQAVTKEIMAYANADNYHQSRSYPKHTITNEPGTWAPTPPAYMDGIEPGWKYIRSFTLDSAQQFKPPLPTKYDMDKNSTFYRETMEVYEAVKSGTPEQKEIASFWDCNPYVMNITGHVMHATKKITPGGHWINIVAVACRKVNADVATSWIAYTQTAVALADGFISCWDEKYRSNLVRPETVINTHIDPDWVPLLQTPPFPEYTSGHSVISSAAAVALTDIFGSAFAFTDDTEVEYGLPARSFNSFLEASAEAAVSRLYGGIHYRPAIDNGVLQGRALGQFVVKKLNFKA